MSKRFCLIVLIVLYFITVPNVHALCHKRVVKPIPVILDTDMGNDIDDALALDMLYKYMDNGKINLLAILLNKDYIHAPEYIDIMNTWYGYPNIPIGIYKTGDKLNTNDKNYTQRVCNKRVNGEPLFNRTIKDYNALPDSYKLYRKILSGQPDKSVTIISIGFLTNLELLLESSADEYSALSGKELIKKKVKLLSIMAGSFTEKPYAEYNVLMNKKAATKVFSVWPSSIIVSPFELGDSIKYPGSSIANDFKWADKHPLVEGFKEYNSNPSFKRPTWDLTSVLCVIEPDSSFFTLSPKGIITSDSNGYTHFVPKKKGKHQYLSASSEQKEKVLNSFIRIITTKPKNK